MKSEELIRRKTRFGIDKYSIVQGRKVGSYFISDQLATGRENVIEKRIAGRPVIRRPSYTLRRVDRRKTGYFSWYGGTWVAREESEPIMFDFVEAKPVLISREPLYKGSIDFRTDFKTSMFDTNLRELGIEDRHIFKISGAPNDSDNGYKVIVTVGSGSNPHVKFKERFAGDSGAETIVEIPDQLLADNLFLFGDYVWFATRFALYRGCLTEEDLVEEISKVSGVPQNEDTSEFYPNHIYRCCIYEEGSGYVMLTEERKTRNDLGARIRKYESSDLENWNLAGYVKMDEMITEVVENFPTPKTEFYVGDNKTNLSDFLGDSINTSNTSIFICETGTEYEAYVVGDFNMRLLSDDGSEWNFDAYFSVKREDEVELDEGLAVLAVI